MGARDRLGGRVGAQIAHARREQGWTQIQLAEVAGVSRPTVARIEAGQQVGLAILVKVAEVLGLQVQVSVQRVGE